jgi:hypothetical protein
MKQTSTQTQAAVLLPTWVSLTGKDVVGQQRPGTSVQYLITPQITPVQGQMRVGTASI